MSRHLEQSVVTFHCCICATLSMQVVSYLYNKTSFQLAQRNAKLCCCYEQCVRMTRGVPDPEHYSSLL